MNFNSYIFVLGFLPISLIVFYVLGYFKKYKLSQIFLIVDSLIFYGYFKTEYILLLVGSVSINYLISKKIGGVNNKKKKKIYLIIGLFLNLSLLIYFKYFNFLIENFNRIFSSNIDFIDIIIPLGISFFTFQQLSYLIDSYTEKLNYKFIDYASYVIFFPQLIAGPITLHNEMIPQMTNIKNKKFNIKNFSIGFYSFSYGFFQKIILADTFAKVANFVFDNPTNNSMDLIIGLLAYTFQIYFDFNGYCDMGIGISYMFNIKLPINFDSPYRSLSIKEFWKKWHITLTRFFTKYVYIPLGGNKKGRIRTYINIMIVFLISGIWHGANYTFILWGILHGIASIFDRLFVKIKKKINLVFNWIITFIFINICWLFFRADSINIAFNMLKNIFKFNIMPISSKIEEFFILPEFKYILNFFNIKNNSLCMLVFIVYSFLLVFFMKNTTEKIKNFKPTQKNAIVSAILFFWSIISIFEINTFIYVNF